MVLKVSNINVNQRRQGPSLSFCIIIMHKCQWATVITMTLVDLEQWQSGKVQKASDDRQLNR